MITQSKMKAILLFFILLTNRLIYGQVSDTIENQSTGSRNANQKQIVVPQPELTDPAFIDYSMAEIYLSADHAITENAYLRRNFTDQFISVWQNPGRIYPASLIYGFSQEGKYYRACKFDGRNSIFGEQVVRGDMSLYYCRKLPQEAGLIEFISMDPHNQGYRNFMIATYKDRARFENDYYYFVTLASDSLTPVPIKDLTMFNENYLKHSPDAFRMMKQFDKKKNTLQRILAPVITGLVCVAAISAGSVESGILISSPLIVGGVAYNLVKKKKAPSRPDPNRMAEIIRLYNNTIVR